MQTTWRLIPAMVADGATYMAIDTFLLDQVAKGQSPVLRFYRWAPVAISLGYHQRHWPDHWRSLTWQATPVDLVRRPTGGRAVLHQGDLTYAIALPMFSDRRQDLYRHICNALIAAWQHFGVTLTYGTAGRGYRDQANCFALATAADLVTPNGYKLIGSAQLRRDRCLLQHGSIRLHPDPDLYQQVFGADTPLQQPPEMIPPQSDDQWRSQLISQIIQTVCIAFDVEFAPEPLTSAEVQMARARYGDRTTP